MTLPARIFALCAFLQKDIGNASGSSAPCTRGAVPPTGNGATGPFAGRSPSGNPPPSGDFHRGGASHRHRAGETSCRSTTCLLRKFRFVLCETLQWAPHHLRGTL